MKLETQSSYISNPQFTGGAAITAVTGSAFISASADNPAFGFVAGGIYVGTAGTLTAKAYDGSVLTFASASGFIPGIFTAVSGSSTAQNLVALK